jgi:hypothetical protein
LTEATLAKHDAAPVLGDLSAFCDTAHRFRAEAAGAALVTALETRFESWFRTTETGAFLLQAWSLGRAPELTGILDLAGAGSDPFPLLPLYFTTRLG